MGVGLAQQRPAAGYRGVDCVVCWDTLDSGGCGQKGVRRERGWLAQQWIACFTAPDQSGTESLLPILAFRACCLLVFTLKLKYDRSDVSGGVAQNIAENTPD